MTVVEAMSDWKGENVQHSLHGGAAEFWCNERPFIEGGISAYLFGTRSSASRHDQF